MRDTKFDKSCILAFSFPNDLVLLNSTGMWNLSKIFSPKDNFLLFEISSIFFIDEDQI